MCYRIMRSCIVYRVLSLVINQVLLLNIMTFLHISLALELLYSSAIFMVSFTLLD